MNPVRTLPPTAHARPLRDLGAERVTSAAVSLALGSRRARLVYDRAGRAGRAVVFLHGITSSRRIWLPTLADCPPDQQRLALDLPGFGDAELPRRRQTLDDFVTATLAFLHTLARPVDLVGHSFGGMVAALAALAEPASVGRLVLVSAAGFAPPRGAPRPLRLYALNWLWLRLLARQEGGAALLRGVGLDPQRLDPAWRPLLRHGLFRAREVLRMRAFSETEPLGPRLAAAGRRAAYIWGEDDPLFPFAEVRPKLGPGPVWLLPGEGHAPMVGSPDRFAVALNDALSGSWDEEP